VKFTCVPGIEIGSGAAGKNTVLQPEYVLQSESVA
jgi:hypothetical protein